MSKKINRIGERYGMLTVVSESEPYIFPRGQAESVWHCKCDCGGEVDVRSSYLAMGKKTSCGCQSRRKAQTLRRLNATADLTGRKFGHLIVLERVPGESKGYRNILWKVRCELCGTVKTMPALVLRDCVSCGCLKWKKSQIKVCPNCKKIYVGQRQQKFCSEKCKKENRKNERTNRKSGDESICAMCGRLYVLRHGLQKYCPECAKERARAASKKQREKFSNGRRKEYLQCDVSIIGPLPEMNRSRKKCIICGDEFEGFSNSKYCPKCKQTKIQGEEKRKE